MGKIIFRTDKTETKEVITNLPAKTYNYSKTDASGSTSTYELYVYFDSPSTKRTTNNLYNVDKGYTSELKDGEERLIDITFTCRFSHLASSKGGYYSYGSLGKPLYMSGIYINSASLNGTTWTNDSGQNIKESYTDTTNITGTISATDWKIKKNSCITIGYNCTNPPNSYGATVYWEATFNIKEYDRKETITVAAPTITIPTVDKVYIGTEQVYPRT